MLERHSFCARSLTLALCFTGGIFAAPIVGQIDTFNGSAGNWTNGAPAADPIVIATGGPAGAGDGFLQVSADGSGSAGRLTVFNRTQWSGNYVLAGITTIEMDLRNFGSSPLSMRIALKTDITQGAPGYVSTLPFTLAADSLWHHAVFGLDANSVTGVGSPAALATALSNVAELRIINGATVGLNGSPVVSQLGIDNISASAVPEPGAAGLTAAGGLAIVLLRRVRRRRTTIEASPCSIRLRPSSMRWR